MNFITLKELKKRVPIASEFKRVPGLKKILEDGIEVILRKQMENHAEVLLPRIVKCYGTQQSCGESLDGMNTLVRWLWGEERKLM